MMFYFLWGQNKIKKKKIKTKSTELDYTVRMSGSLATSLRFNTSLNVNREAEYYYVHICKKCYK